MQTQPKSKKELEKALSRLATFRAAQIDLKQYSTPSEIAADYLWRAYMLGDIQDKHVVDLGAGTGILGLGAALLGAKKVTMVEKDADSVELITQNISILNFDSDSSKKRFKILQNDITSEDLKLKADTVIMNPPFGTKIHNIDNKFVEVAMLCAPVVYTLHRQQSASAIETLLIHNLFAVSHPRKYTWPLKATMEFHSKMQSFIEVVAFRAIRRE